MSARIARIEAHDHLGDWKYIANGLAELRWKNGRRVYFAKLKDRIILLLAGGYKNEQKKDIKKPISSLESMPSLKVKSKRKLSEFKAVKRMRNKKYVSKALFACLADNDTEGFKDILRVYLELENKEQFAKKAGLSKRTLFRMLSKDGNPTLNSISKIIYQLSA